MSETVLAIGSVTANDYGFVRIEFLREGVRPRFMRLNATTVRKNTIPADEDLLSFDPIWAQIDGMTIEATFQKQVEAAVAILRSLGHVVAVVMDEATWVEWDNPDYGVFTGQLDEIFPDHIKWVVYDNGKVECVN